MKAFQFASVVGALLLTGGGAFAQNDTDTQGSDSTISNPSTPSQDTQQPDVNAPKNDMSGQGMSGTEAQGENAKMPEQASGFVTKVDSSGHKLTLTIPAGSTTTIEQTGHVTNIDRSHKLVTLSLPVAKSAKVTRSGKTAKLSALKQGDDVRVSFDPATKSLTSIEATPGSHAMPKGNDMGTHDMGGTHDMNAPDTGTHDMNAPQQPSAPPANETP